MANVVQLEIDFDNAVEHPDWCIASQCCLEEWYDENNIDCEVMCPLSRHRCTTREAASEELREAGYSSAMIH
jgi:hypothetical protein